MLKLQKVNTNCIIFIIQENFKKWLAFLLSEHEQASFIYETTNSNSFWSLILNDQMVLLICHSFDFESMIQNVNWTK